MQRVCIRFEKGVGREGERTGWRWRTEFHCPARPAGYSPKHRESLGGLGMAGKRSHEQHVNALQVCSGMVSPS